MPPHRSHLSRSIVLTLLLQLGLASMAHAGPIVYKLVVFLDPRETGASPISGSLAGRPFGGPGHDVVMTFTFSGDTANVVPFSEPVSGVENLLGTASVQINSASTGALLSRATFLPAAGIYVSADNTNGGLGFGSFGALPTSPAFPGNPVYPYGANFIYPLTPSYDLVTDGYLELYNNTSCVNFPFACQPGTPLPTTAGDLIVNPVFADGFALFFAEPRATSFESFSAGTVLTPSGDLTMVGKFALGRGSRGINPVTDEVTLRMIDSFGADLPALTIPAGSFHRAHRGTYEFSGSIDGVTLDVQIQATSNDQYSFRIDGGGSPLADAYAGAKVIAVTLMIGDDLGTTTATRPAGTHR